MPLSLKAWLHFKGGPVTQNGVFILPSRLPGPARLPQAKQDLPGQQEGLLHLVTGRVLLKARTY